MTNWEMAGQGLEGWGEGGDAEIRRVRFSGLYRWGRREREKEKRREAAAVATAAAITATATKGMNKAMTGREKAKPH